LARNGLPTLEGGLIYMSELTRRGFLRSASIGAGAVGALSILPRLARAQETAPMPPPTTPAVQPGGAATLAAQTPLLATPVVVFFDDLSSGKGRVFVGEQAIEFNNPAFVQSLRAVVA
jgi:hypothetical protein